MNDILKKLKLIDYLSIELDVTKSHFVNRLHTIVEPGQVTGMFADTFDVFSSSKKRYKGEVTSAGFQIKRRKRLFDFNSMGARVNGTLSHNGDGVRVDMVINGFEKSYIFYFIMIAVFYLFFLGMMLMVDSAPVFVIPFVLLHACFMFGLPYFLMKRAVSSTLHDLERELYFLVRK